MLRIALGSLSAIKQRSVDEGRQLSKLHAQIIAVHTHSGVPEQPFGDETVRGAKNRAIHAAALVPDADFSIGIENGIFERDGRFLDIAVLVARLKTGVFLRTESDVMEVEAEAVRETLLRGTHAWTVGMVLQEWGRVAQHDDPHLSLAKRSRVDFLKEGVLRLFQVLHDQDVL